MIDHKKGKTFKYIIRNLYFFLALALDTHEPIPAEPNKKWYRIWFDHGTFYLNKKRIEIVNEFFKRTLFDNPHLTLNERRAKQDARIMFQQEVLKNLTDHVGPQ